MKQTPRFLFHVFLWSAVWLMAWLILDENTGFLGKNLPSFFMQIFVVGLLIYITAPRLLFKKKYVLFAVASIAIITLCSLMITERFMSPFSELHPPRPGGPPGMRPNAPPQIFIQFLVLSIAYMLATFMETFLFAQKQEEETIRNKSENLQMELKLLKSQINPHFLFNALNNIYALSVIDSNKTQESIGTLSDMLRYVLYECEQPMVSIDKEVAYIENYLRLFSLKSSKPFMIKTDFMVADKNASISPMIFIPFVENALKHGNVDYDLDGFLKIKLHSQNQSINFEVENSISKITVHKDKVGGIGLENVKKRLQILYPNKHRLMIEESGEKYAVNLSIDLNGTD
ncbi:histidine kinase [Flavobacteriaceae bacterium MAR_2009_75]|nr:histidine kinase [Flavobacteriaceae bacterium MAR_2009_75]